MAMMEINVFASLLHFLVTISLLKETNTLKVYMLKRFCQMIDLKS